MTSGRASGSPSRAKRRRAKRGTSGQRLFAFDRRLGVRFVAGADEAGRGCLAGPLVAAGVLFDYESLTTRELRALGALNDSKQHTHEAREELYPWCCAAPRASWSSHAAPVESMREGCTRRTLLRCATRCGESPPV